MIISAASDYRAAAQRILPPFLFHLLFASIVCLIPRIAAFIPGESPPLQITPIFITNTPRLSLFVACV